MSNAHQAPDRDDLKRRVQQLEEVLDVRNERIRALRRDLRHLRQAAWKDRVDAEKYRSSSTRKLRRFLGQLRREPKKTLRQGLTSFINRAKRLAKKVLG